MRALDAIDEVHYRTAHVKVIDDQLNIFDDHFTTYENNFTGKLESSYAVLTHTKAIDNPRNLIRQLQIPKRYASYATADPLVVATVERLKELTGSDQDKWRELTTIPDFFIHASEFDQNRLNQELIVEVKTEQDLSYPRFAWDFFKLTLYLNMYNFQTAVFLSVNSPQALIDHYIARYLDEGLYQAERPQDLFVIVKEGYSAAPVTKTLRRFLAKI
ncbi:hypothetical protein ACFGVR_15090 [Mucilaginibacter sp. AW1-3]